MMLISGPPSGSKTSHSPGALEPERSLRLPTGLRVELAVSRSPLGYDVAVCPTDERGSPGLLNQLVLGALGYDADQLAREFRPPATLIESTSVPVLVVQTVRRDTTSAPEGAALLDENLRRGLALLDDVRMRTHIWLPLLGTGGGQLPMPQSLRAMLTSLAAWKRGHTHRVTIAAPDEEVLSELISALDARTPPTSAAPPRKRTSSKRSRVVQDETTPSDKPFRTQPHVASALSLALTLSKGDPIHPWQMAQAIILLAERSRSSSFVRFRALVRIEADLPNAALDPDALHDESVDPSLLSDSLRQQLLWAQGNVDEPRFGVLRGRHLVSAVLLCEDDQLAAALRRGGSSIDRARDRWYRYVTRAPEPRAPWDEWWTSSNVPLPGPRRAGHVTETDQGEDKLGVEAEAAAFARLILDERIEPPLSIGLLGDWGSGKSFFIEQIKNQVAGLRGSPGLHEHVVEIEFNAWHASDANLWASLVTHIFDEIWSRVAKNDSEGAQKRARAQLTRAISRARGALHEAEDQVAVARAALKEAEEALAERRRALHWDARVRSLTRARLTEIAEQAGFRNELETVTDVEAAARSLVSGSYRLGLMLTSVLERPVLRVGLPTGALMFATGAAWLGAEYWPALLAAPPNWLGPGIKLVSAIVGGLGALLAPLGVASARMNRLSNALRRIIGEYDTAVQGAAADVQAEVARARLELDSAAASVDVARQRLADLMNQQAALDPGRRLSAFLQERVASAPYRAQQGIISLVHRDFRELSARMRAWRDARRNPALDSTEIPADIQPFDRIVLYVDDLDRCRPQQVVQMLEAVHLLLALDLFVVVVAVDSRWLTRALQVHYKELLASDDDVVDDGMRRSTAQNYLEKIFQITYALGPMNPAKFGDYVRHLTDSDTDRAVPLTPRAAPVVSSSPPPSGSTSSSRAAPAVAPATYTASSRPPSVEPGVSSGVRPAPRLPEPRAVPIGTHEREFLSRLGPLLPTPRLAKRLVNAYRLVKAMKDLDVVDDDEPSDRYRATLVLLAILFGHPSIAAELFRRLHEQSAPFDNASRRLSEAIRGEGAEWRGLADQLDTVGVELRVGDCITEPVELARYSLVTSHDWHLWKPATSRGGGAVEAFNAAK